MCSSVSLLVKHLHYESLLMLHLSKKAPVTGKLFLGSFSCCCPGKGEFKIQSYMVVKNSFEV